VSTEPNRTPAALRERLAREGQRFGFYRAVLLLERLAADEVSLGGAGPIDREVARLQHDPGMGFHSSDVKSITHAKDGVGPTSVVTTFFGLFGAVSPLPAHMAEDVIAAEGADEHALRAFYDILHHRLLSLLFRAWRRHRVVATFEPPDYGEFTRRLLCFVGVDTTMGSRPGGGLPPLTALGLAPLLALRARTAHSLEVVLQEVFPGVPSRVVCFVPRRVAIATDQRAQLGVRCSTLGGDLTLGSSVEDRSGRFRVVLGPVNRSTFDALSPGGSSFWLLRAVLGEFARGVLEPEVSVVLDAASVPVLQLGDRAASELGRTTRLGGGASRPIQSRFVVGLGGQASSTPVLLDGDDDA
jgi:type VI secretion system protein ImpH